MSKHTPGPWKVRRVDLGPNASNLHGASREEREVLANARLIAAAPELLEALKTLVEKVGCHCEETHTGEVLESRYLCPIHEAERVIAKAEGRE